MDKPNKASELNAGTRSTIEQLANETDAARQSELFRNYLRTSAVFWDYSWLNCMLIYRQRPDASHVAGFNGWLKCGRYVRRGEKGISILAPMFFRDKSADGEEAKRLWFKVVHVFDISQTDGTPLPELPSRSTGERGEDMLARLLRFAESRVIAVRFVERCSLNGAAGTSRGKEIEIRTSEISDPARTVVGVAAFLGLRRSEIRGLEWQDYSGDEVRVMRSVWESVTSEPKTRKSKAPVPVIVPIQKLLDKYRKSRGNPQLGPMFATMKKPPTPLSLNNMLNRQILPVLDVCVCGKTQGDHDEEDHDYQRGTRPEWHGWHGFRRGLATNLYGLGVPDKTIQAILRHANVQVTQNSYIKTLDSQSIAAMRQLESLVDVKLISGR